MADKSQLNSQFWQAVHERIDNYSNGQNNSFQYFNPHSRRKRPSGRNHKRNHILRKVITTPSGAHKLYLGSGGNGNSNFTHVPLNDLNIMDFINWRGYPFYLLDSNNGADYSLGNKSKAKHPTPGLSDLSSLKVALHPQPAYDNDGKPIKNKNGQVAAVAGQGGYFRFSRRNYGSLIGIIKELEGVGTKEAYQIQAQMVREYGTETKFDPFDKSMRLPRNSEGEFVYTNGNYSVKAGKRSQKQRPTNFNGYHQKVAMFSRHILRDAKIGEEPLKHLHDLGYDDQKIKDAQIGYLPSGKAYDMCIPDNASRGFIVQSQLFHTDPKGKLTPRFNGQYIRPIKYKKHFVGLQAYDKQMNPTQKISSGGEYRSDLGDQLNSWNDEFKNNGAKFNRTDEKGRAFAKGYLCNIRGIAPNMVDRMMSDGYIRVGFGRKGNQEAARKAQSLREQEIELEKHSHEYVQKVGKKAYQKYADQNSAPVDSPQAQKDIQSMGKEAYNKYASNIEAERIHNYYMGRDFPAYVEFPQHLNNDFTKNHDQVVGADRIQFDPKSNDYHIFEMPDGRQQYKKVEKGGMHNYGYNFTCGKNCKKQRDLYVFEAPVDAISYADIYSNHLLQKRRASDFLSLSGSGSKASTISNFMNNKRRETGQNYHHIYFCTDNDIHGQQLIQEYTENSRVHWDRDKVNKFFSTLIPPYKKDWNDTRQFYADPDNDPATLKDHKVEYNMDELNDKILQDDTKGMTDVGKKHMCKINQCSRNLFLEYENGGENANAPMNQDVLKSIHHEKAQMRRDSPNDADIYDKFKKDIGDSYSPKEIIDSACRLYDQGMFFRSQQADRTHQMAENNEKAETTPQGHPSFIPENRQDFGYQDANPYFRSGYSSHKPSPSSRLKARTRSSPQNHPSMVPKNRRLFHYENNHPHPYGDYQPVRPQIQRDQNGDPDPFAFSNKEDMKKALQAQDQWNKSRPGANPKFHKKEQKDDRSQDDARSYQKHRRHHYRHHPKMGGFK